MTYDPNLPAEATAIFRYKPELAPITVIGTWDPKQGCFARFPRYYVNGLDVSWPYLNLCDYPRLEAKALIVLSRTMPTKEESARLIFDYMEIMDVSQVYADAATYAGHDRFVRNLHEAGAKYLAVGRNLKTGHWEWQEEVIEAELTPGERQSMADDERFDCMKDDSHL